MTNRIGNLTAVLALAALSFISGLIFPLCGNTAENLIADGSFENIKTKDRFGRVFNEWLGWVYEKNGWFEVSPIASKGNYSCLMRSDEHGKIRMQSPKLDLKPGRYEISFDIRGLDIAPHKWKRPMDFSMGFDNKFFALNHVGNFDWTRIRYVFDLPDLKKKPQFFLGLLGTGWLWVDNVRLIRVGPDVPLTEKPQWLTEPKPIKPVENAEPTVRCGQCGFLNQKNAGKSTCSICGTSLKHVKPGHESGVGLIKILADFEQSRKPFSTGRIVNQFATQGRKSLILEKGWTSILSAMDFSGYDQILFDVYNPGSKAVPLLVEIRDVESKGYWGRVNYNTMAPPGESTVFLPTQLYVGEKSRPGRSLLEDQVTFFSIGVGNKGPVYIDNFRLKRLDLDRFLFKELLAFDFGPSGSPLMAGFLPVNKGVNYAEGRGYGFLGAQLWRSHNVLQPDPLLQDFVCP
jgi:hypothetical protein